LAEDLFVLTEEKLPDKCSVRFRRKEGEVYREWRTGKQHTVIWTALPPLPPGSRKAIIDLILECGAVPDSDVVIDIALGCRDGPGVSRRITLPGRLLGPAVKQYTANEPDPRKKRAGDNHYTNEIVALLSDQSCPRAAHGKESEIAP
jgi:hypothetical protein